MRRLWVMLFLGLVLLIPSQGCHAGGIDMSTGESSMLIGKSFSPGKSLVLDCVFEPVSKNVCLLVRANVSADELVPGKMSIYKSARVSIAASGGFRGYQNIFIEGSAKEKILYFIFKNSIGRSKLKIKIENYSKSGVLAVKKLDFKLVDSNKINDLNYADRLDGLEVDPVALSPDLQSSRLVPVDRIKYGFNSKYDFLNFNSVKLLNDKKINKLSPGIIRFPGGTDSNFYRFEYDGFDEQDLRNFPDYAGRAGYKALFKKYKRGGREVGRAKIIKWANDRSSKLVLVLNVFAYSPEETTKFIDSVLSEGGQVAYVELGNEIYFDSQRGNKFEDVHSYLEYVKRLIPILRSRHPNVRIGVPINEKNNKWNKAIAEANLDFDACVLHPYFVTSSIFSHFNDSQILEYAKYGQENIIRIISSLFSGKKVWVTEYNVFDRPFFGSKFDSSIGAMYSARSFLTFINSGDVELACFHALLGHSLGLANVPFGKDDAVKMSVPLWFWERVDDLMQPGWESSPVSFSERGVDSDMLKYKIDMQYFLNRSTGDKIMLIVNTLNRSIELKDINFGSRVESLICNPTKDKFVEYDDFTASSGVVLSPMSINFIY